MKILNFQLAFDKISQCASYCGSSHMVFSRAHGQSNENDQMSRLSQILNVSRRANQPYFYKEKFFGLPLMFPELSGMTFFVAVAIQLLKNIK